ncbi:MAG: PAS domain S-box protein [Pedobacter sp.]|nr:MAG: PAS domain S-box protein [Pedobacter sp.]
MKFMTVPQVPQDQTALKEAVDFEQQLLQYQKRISNILESFTDAFFEVDRSWVVTYWNKEAEHLLGKSREEIIGKNLWEVYPDAVNTLFFEQYNRALAQNSAVRFEEYYEAKALWFEVAAFPSGEGLSVYFKDITASRETILQLQNERQKYRELFNLSPVPQWVYEYETLKFLDVNEAAISHYGYTRDEFLGMTLKDIRPQSDLLQFQETIKKEVIQGALSTSTVRHQKKNGDIIAVLVKGNSIFFDGKTARLVMVIDRTAEIEAMMAIEAQNVRLQEISWIQSHKVRSPLSSIMGLVSLIELSKADLPTINELIPLLKLSADELDQVLREILKKVK